METKCQVKKNVVINGKEYVVDAETGDLHEILTDISSTGRKRPWKKHKIENMKLAEIYDSLAESEIDKDYWQKRGDRLRNCNTHLGFSVFDGGTGDETMKVTHAESCRVRLCPLCSWRRTIKIFTHARKIIEKMQEEGKYAYIMVTLTVPNVTADKLNETITRMMEAWRKFQQYKKFDKAVEGWYRGLEVTHNVNKRSSSYDTYHPHFHCILAVNKSYFDSRDYISRNEWLEMWRRAYRDETITQVDVRRVKPKKGKDPNDIIGAVAEVAKYTVKAGDYILPNNWDLSCDSVRILDKALANRRLVAFGGVMKDLHKKLNLDDEIDGDLIEDGDCENGKPTAEVMYFWHVGYQEYIKE